MTIGWLAIVNPRSGRGAERPSFRPILESLERVVDKIVFTEGVGHAREIASHAAGYGGLDGLIASLRDLPLTEEHITLKGADLEGYDALAISRIFEDGSAVVSLASLRHEITSRGEAVAEAVEELVHILEKYDMTHVALVCGEPTTLLLLDLPQVATQLYEVQVRLIQKYSRLLERTMPAGA